jgi:type I site-specific restriction endonuclease
MNEAETRAEHIDPALKAAGWGVIEGSRVRREYPITLGRLEGHGKRAKPLIADYALVYRNIKLAVVEAEQWDEPLMEASATFARCLLAFKNTCIHNRSPCESKSGPESREFSPKRRP